jgi:MFS family permease
MGLFTLSGVFGRMIGGWFQDIFPARFVFVMGLALMAVGIALGGLFSAGSILLAYLASVILGFGFGSSVTNLPTILGNYFGHDAFSKLYGTAFMIALIIASFAGILGGKLFDVFHNYYVAWEICIAISIAGIVALFFTVPPHPARQ